MLFSGQSGLHDCLAPATQQTVSSSLVNKILKPVELFYFQFLLDSRIYNGSVIVRQCVTSVDKPPLCRYFHNMESSSA